MMSGQPPPPPPSGPPAPPPAYIPQTGGPPVPPQYAPPPTPPSFIPPMPHPSDPSYAAWYYQYYTSYMQYYYPPGYYQRPASAPPSMPPATLAPSIQHSAGPPSQPPPPGYESPAPQKVLPTNLLAPPPPPPPDPGVSTTSSSVAAKAQPVVYKNPRPPSPSPPHRPPVSEDLKTQWPVASKPSIEPTPEIQRLEAEMKQIEAEIKSQKPKFQWYYDGQSWVYTTEPPAVKPSKPEDNPEFNYSFASNDDPVRKAVLANMRGNFNKPDKPKAVPIRCEVCNISVTCQVTYNTHVKGKNHQKKMVQMNKKLEQQKKLASIKAKEVEQELGMAAEEELDDVDEYNPLQILPNGDTRCELCSCNMNSEPQAITHVNGSKHRRALEKYRRSQRGRGRGRGRGGFSGGFGRGMSRGGLNQKPVPLMQVDTGFGPPCPGDDEDDDQEAIEEYNAAFEEALANNVDVQEAHRIAETARQAMISRQGFSADDTELIQPFEEDEEGQPTFPPRGIVILASSGGLGQFRCDLCHVLLTSENDLEHHLVSPKHLSLLQMNTEGYSGSLPPGMRGARGGPRVHRGGGGRGAMKAQRGRKGLIAEGEIIPAKRSKTEKKAAKAEMGNIIEQMRNTAKTEETKEVKTTNNKWNSMDKMKPLLMTFVKGETMTSD